MEYLQQSYDAMGLQYTFDNKYMPISQALANCSNL